MRRYVPDTPWLRHPRVWFLIGVFSWSAMLLMWMAGREPPIVVTVPPGVVTLVIGQSNKITVNVNRNLSRRCSVEISRNLIDAGRVNHSTLAFAFKTAKGIAELEAMHPGKLSIAVVPPVGAAPGPGFLTSEDRYICPFNPTTWIEPIEDSWSVPVYLVDAEKQKP